MSPSGWQIFVVIASVIGTLAILVLLFKVESLKLRIIVLEHLSDDSATIPTKEER